VPVSIDNGPLITVSCPSTTFCAAGDGFGYAVTFNGLSWSQPRAVNNTGQSISCASASFCMATDGTGSYSTYDGTNWSTPTDPVGQTLYSTTCPSARFCVTGGGNWLGIGT